LMFRFTCKLSKPATNIVVFHDHVLAQIATYYYTISVNSQI